MSRSAAPRFAMSTASVRQILLSRMESELPDAILAILRQEDGKPLTKRLLAKLPGGEAEWRIRAVAGMTYLETMAYIRSSGNEGVSLLMAYAEKSVKIDASWVEEHNPAYYAGRRKRNAERRASSESDALCTSMALALDAVQKAHEALRAAEAQLEAFTGYDKPFSADGRMWQALASGAGDDAK